MLEENRFENVLTSLRKRRGWTQEDAAAHIGKGMSRHTYINVEKGNIPPSQKHLKLIETGFKLSQTDTDALYHAAHYTPPRIHNLPFPQNLLFTGREAQLKQLGQLLRENYSVALSGLPGIGKTQLALEYAHRCYVAKDYQAVFWVSAADEESLRTGFVMLAGELDLPERDEQEQAKIIRAVKVWLERHTNWLLIMDNADNLQLARSFFPEVNEGSHGHILLTTRSLIVSDVPGDIIEVDKMKPTEGLLFLLRRAFRRKRKLQDEASLDSVAPDIREAASHLVELLGRHPLALDHAGAYFEDNPLVSFTDYINLYHVRRSDLLSERGSLAEETDGKYSYHPESVVVTFKLCFEKARERHPLATDILRFCALLHPDAIPKELFQHDDTFKLDTSEMWKGIRALLRYSLIKPNTNNMTYSIHRLVQAVLIDDMASDSDLQRQLRKRVVHALRVAFPVPDFKEWSRCEGLVTHVLVCANWTDEGLTPTREVASLFYAAGAYLHQRERYSEAEGLLKRALTICDQHIEVEPAVFAGLLQSLSTNYLKQGDYSEPQFLLDEVLKIRKYPFDLTHPDFAHTLHILAVVAFVREEVMASNTAKELLEQLLSRQENYFGAEHPDIAKTLTILAIFYMFYAEYERSELFYQRALSILEKQLGPDHPEIAPILSGYALLMDTQGRLEQAQALCQRALSIGEQSYGASSSSVQNDKRFYADLMRKIERNAGAAVLEENDDLPK